jgi:hypothetical protein
VYDLLRRPLVSAHVVQQMREECAIAINEEPTLVVHGVPQSPL